MKEWLAGTEKADANSLREVCRKTEWLRSIRMKTFAIRNRCVLHLIKEGDSKKKGAEHEPMVSR